MYVCMYVCRPHFPRRDQIKTDRRKMRHLLFRILWMWLVCQLLVHRHQVGEGDLTGQNTGRQSLRITHVLITILWNMHPTVICTERVINVSSTHICRFELKDLLSGVHNWVFLDISACSCNANNLREKGAIPVTVKKHQSYSLINQSMENEHILQIWPWQGDPTLCWAAFCCVTVPLCPRFCPERPHQTRWGSWGWGTSASLPWSPSPTDGC